LLLLLLLLLFLLLLFKSYGCYWNNGLR